MTSSVCDCVTIWLCDNVTNYESHWAKGSKDAPSDLFRVKFGIQSIAEREKNMVSFWKINDEAKQDEMHFLKQVGEKEISKQDRS